MQRTNAVTAMSEAFGKPLRLTGQADFSQVLGAAAPHAVGQTQDSTAKERHNEGPKTDYCDKT